MVHRCNSQKCSAVLAQWDCWLLVYCCTKSLHGMNSHGNSLFYGWGLHSRLPQSRSYPPQWWDNKENVMDICMCSSSFVVVCETMFSFEMARNHGLCPCHTTFLSTVIHCFIAFCDTSSANFFQRTHTPLHWRQTRVLQFLSKIWNILNSVKKSNFSSEGNLFNEIYQWNT